MRPSWQSVTAFRPELAIGDLSGMPFDPNIPRLDKRALAICIVMITALIVGIWLVHSYVLTDYDHPSQQFEPPNPK
jgi:hypothetical protein